MALLLQLATLAGVALILWRLWKMPLIDDLNAALDTAEKHLDDAIARDTANDADQLTPDQKAALIARIANLDNKADSIDPAAPAA